MAVSETGFLLVTDISGYTAFLGESELEHARETLTSLLEVLVDRARPPLVVSKLEGDAVLSYTPDGSLLSGQTLIEIIETTYVAFRRAIDLMVLNNTCQCNACANVSALDLKLFLHHGSFALQRVGDREELFGPEVVLTHRLLKNTISADTGFTAYAAFTDAAVARLGEELRQGLTRVDLSYDDVGQVEVWVADMHPVWASWRDENVVDLKPEEIDVDVSTRISMPPEVIWDYFNDPRFRMTLLGADRVEMEGRRNGRVAEGSTIQCYHGDKVTSQVILEWRPFHRVVTRDRIPYFGGRLQVLTVGDLSSDDSGAILRLRIGAMTGPLVPRLLCRLVLRAGVKGIARQVEAFRDQAVADYASRVPIGGWLRGSVMAPPGADVTQPVLGDWEAASE